MQRSKMKGELVFIRDWCKTIFTYLEGQYPDNEYFPVFNQSMDEGYKIGILSGMRETFRDCNGMAKSFLAPSEYKKLNAILMDKFGMDIDTASNTESKKIASFVRRGYLRNIDEYRLVSQWLGDINVDDCDMKLVNKLEELLIDYEERKGKH